MKLKKSKFAKSALLALVATGGIYSSLATAQTSLPLEGDNTQGTIDGWFYSFWKENDNGASMTYYDGGRYTSSWQSNVGNWVGGIGWKPGGPRKISYSGSYNINNSQNSYLALYGWTRNELIEYYVIESYGSYNPSNCSGGQNFGSYQSDGATYNIRRCFRDDKPSIEGDSSDFYQFFSVRTPKKGFGQISGTITMENHFNGWANAGLHIGSTHDYMILATEGYNSQGGSDLRLVEEPRNCGTPVDGLPVCCEITADPDGDGIGSQFTAGQQCIVTQETIGWHPPNPDDVIAAINVGGGSEAIEFEGVYYKPSAYVTGISSHTTEDSVSGSGSAIHQSEGYGPEINVAIPLNGQQNITLDMAFVEMYHEQAGQRIFDIYIEDDLVVSNKDLFADHGHDQLWMPDTYELTIYDDELNIRLVNKAEDNATLSSILVRAVEDAASSSSQSSSSVSSSSVSSTPASSTPAQSSSSAPSQPPVSAGSLDYLFALLLGGGLMGLRRRAVK